MWLSCTYLEVDRTVSGVMMLSFCLDALTVFVGGLPGNERLLITVSCDMTLWLFCVKIACPSSVCVMSSMLMGPNASNEGGGGIC